VADAPGTIREMSRLGRGCLVTYYQSQRQALDKTMDSLALGNRATIRRGDDTWTAVWWHNR
jgi:hypothetical protein